MASGRITRIKFHNEGFNALRRSPEVHAAMKPRAEAIAEEATAAAQAVGFDDAEFVVIETDNASRARFIVTTGNFEAMLAEAKHRVLTNALGAGRG